MLFRLCTESALVCTINPCSEQQAGAGHQQTVGNGDGSEFGGVFFMLPFRNKARKANAANQLGQASRPKYLSVEICTHTIHSYYSRSLISSSNVHDK